MRIFEQPRTVLDRQDAKTAKKVLHSYGFARMNTDQIRIRAYPRLSASIRSKALFALLGGLGVLAVFLSSPALSAEILDPDRALKVSQAVIGKEVGDYAFRDRAGKQVRLAEYRGKPLVVSFVYTGCFSVCPTTTARVAKAIGEARKTLGTGSFRVATIGFNLPFDSPEAMRDFARRYGIDDPSWEFLSPYEQQLPQMLADFGFEYVRTAGGFDHITQLTIVDGDGKVYRQVYGDEFALPLLIDPLQQLVTGKPLAQASLSDWIERIRIVCTVYDPKSGKYRFKTAVIGDVVSFVFVTIAVFGFVWYERRRRRQAGR
jgi:protein SCO1/2